ncbi:MAG: MOSC domain-containing protein [Gemmatimonadota bacterium]|nr:MOSC domain-containing protein [Gemmatimonadota bacterium]
MSKPAARLEAIWLKGGRREAMRPVSGARMVKDVGLEGNADRGGYRQVTLLDADAWERATSELGVVVDPIERRANLLVRGLDLAESADRVVRVGASRIRIRGETRPCERMDEAAPGLREALDPDWRAGAYGMVIEGGPVTVGDPVAWEA